MIPLLLLPVAFLPAPLAAPCTPAAPLPENGHAIHWNKGRGYSPFLFATPDGISIVNRSASPVIDSCRLETASGPYSLTFRASASDAPWGFFISSGKEGKTWVTVSRNESDGVLSSSPSLLVSASRDAGNTVLAETSVKEGLDIFNGPNIWRVVSADGRVSISAGNRSPVAVIDYPVADSGLVSFGFAAAPGGRLRIEDVSLRPVSPLSSVPLAIDPELIKQRIASSDDPLVGYWTLFDRTLDEDLLRTGGDYRLAIIKDDGLYLIIYLEGALVNAAKWKPGMVKGILSPGYFPGIYDVSWTDAEGLVMTRDIKAQSGEGDTLLIQFPYQSSSLRLRKVMSR